MPHEDRFDERSTRLVLDSVCRRVGLDGSGAELMRLGENALYRLTGASVVVRIARSMDYWADAVKEVKVSRWLIHRQFPAAEIVNISQPIEVAGHPVTFWRYIDGRDGVEKDGRALGVLLKGFHRLPPPDGFKLPVEDALGRVAARIDRAPVPPSDRSFLSDLYGQLAAEVARLRFPLPPGPTHGDAHVSNLMFKDGEPLLIDFERVSWGHPEWDLAVTATEYRSGGWWTNEEYGEFVDGYGFDVTDWAGFDVLRRTHEIKMTTWIMQRAGDSASFAAEYERRMRTIRGGSGGDWHPY